MGNVLRSEYIVLSRILCRKLFKEGCFGKGSMYFENLCRGLSDRELKKTSFSKEKVQQVLDALVKQGICGKKKKEHGWKYFLAMERIDKIMEIIKETGQDSIVPILLFL